MTAATATPSKLVDDTNAVVDSLIVLWQAKTDTEDARALIARSIRDALLEARHYAYEWDELDLAVRQGA